jgi:hypothetical protein
MMYTTYLTSLTDVFGQICRQPPGSFNGGGGGNHFAVDKESVSQAAVAAATAATAATDAAAAGVTDKDAVRSVAR